MQYLLSIDYFALPGEPKVDKSSWVASVTSISGCHNGGLSPNAVCLNDKYLLEADCKKFYETFLAEVAKAGFKTVASIQNVFDPACLGTQEHEPENVVKVFKQNPQSALKPILVGQKEQSDQDIMFELGNQYRGMMDFNFERVGYNKLANESHLEYIHRLVQNDFASKSHDHAVPEITPQVFEQRNVLIKTFSNTYYFSISTGEKKKSFGKAKEFLDEPEKLTKMALGFDTDVIQNLKLTGSIRKIKNQGRQKVSSWDRVYTFFRQATNPLSIFHKLFLPNFAGFKQPRYLNNLFNPSMNNVMAFDYANYDHTSDNDCILSRNTTEFPRLSMNFRSKADMKHAPWGQKSKPVRFNCWQESPLATQHSCERETTLGGHTFERGVWYYSGLGLIDHHDLSGLENPFAALETICGRETRPQLFINILNRLRCLDFSESTEQDADGKFKNNSCTMCRERRAKHKKAFCGAEPDDDIDECSILGSEFQRERLAQQAELMADDDDISDDESVLSDARRDSLCDLRDDEEDQ